MEGPENHEQLVCTNHDEIHKLEVKSQYCLPGQGIEFGSIYKLNG